MRRRSYLASVAGLAATGGCLGGVSAALPVNGRNSAPGTPARCPRFDAAARSVCVGETAPATLSRSDASVSDGDEFVVTLTNEDADDVATNPYAWTVYYRDENDWTQVAPDAFLEPVEHVARGTSTSWHLLLGEDGGTRADDGVYVDPLGLADGEHAFTVLAVVDGERTEFVAPFTVA